MSNIVGEKKIKIILALEQAKGAAPGGYIAQKSGIDDPSELLRQLEEDGAVCRLPSDSWSASNAPQYQLTSKAKKLLQQLVATQLEQLIARPQVGQVRT